jgi:PAS domain-containing protein
MLEIIIEAFIFLSSVISLFAAFYQISHYRRPIARWSALVLLGISINLFCYFLLIENSLPGAGRFLVFFQVVSYLLLDVSFFMFVIYFSNHPKWVSRLVELIISLSPIVILGFLVSQWETIPSILSPGNGFGLATNLTLGTQGVAEYLFIAFSNFVGYFSLFLLILMFGKSPTLYRRTILWLILGTAAIATAGLLEILGANPFEKISVLQTVVAMVVIPVMLIVFNWQDINSIPINQELLKEAMRDGYLILDVQSRVIDFNQSMTNILEGKAHIQIGEHLPAGLSKIDLFAHQIPDNNKDESVPFFYQGRECVYEVKVNAIRGTRNELIGTMVIFHNVTDLEKLETALVDRRNAITHTNILLNGLAEATFGIQKSDDVRSMYKALSEQLRKIDLDCFILRFDQRKNELFIDYFSARPGSLSGIEKALGFKIIGYHLSRQVFNKLYVFYENPQNDFFMTTFRGQGDNIEQTAYSGFIKAIHLAGIDLATSITILRLPLGHDAPGLIGIWGTGMHSEDLDPLRLFANQVALAIERSDNFHKEVQRSLELERSNRLITALAKVSTQVSRSTNSDMVWKTLGEELEQVGLHCIFAEVNTEKDTVTFQYVSFRNKVLKYKPILNNFELLGYQIPKKYWPSDTVIKDGTPYWYQNIYTIFSKMFPHIPESIFVSVQMGKNPD